MPWTGRSPIDGSLPDPTARWEMSYTVPDLKQFRLPDVGEGLTEADILSWSVGPGDTVVVNQTLVEVETAKAAVELPSPYAGVVTALHAGVGETVDVGRPIITIDTAPATGTQAAAPPAGERQAVLVGYGPRPGPATRRSRRPATDAGPTPTAQAVFVVDPTSTDPAPPALAKPPVRLLAKSLGVDLAQVTPTGPNGSVSRADVQRASTAQAEPGGAAVAAAAAGSDERLPVKGVRKHTAAAMVASAFTAPHVTEFVTADVSAMMELRERLARRPEFGGAKVSTLALVARAVVWAVRRTPIINSTWDEAAGEIVIKHYVNLGIAAATGRGLVVPNIKRADARSLPELVLALGELTETARSGRTTPAAMSGGTITITNVGVFGVDTGTPIINPGESAIVALGAVRRAPWVVSDADGIESIQPRWVTQLAVSFDHRVVDGEQGSVFLSDVAAVLTDPGLALL